MDSPKTRRAVIIGATSGIGYEVAQLLLAEGWYLGIAGRRRENLLEFQKKSPDRIKICALDIRKEGAENELEKLIGELGGMDLFLQSSGIGFQNFELSPDIELNTLETNGTGFVRMVGYAFRYFRQQSKGHIAVISSIAELKAWVSHRPIRQPSVSRIHTSMHSNNYRVCITCISVSQTSGRVLSLPDF